MKKIKVLLPQLKQSSKNSQLLFLFVGQMVSEILSLPMWEYLLAVCISCYGVNTIFSFAFSVPKTERNENVLVPYGTQNYIFWLLTSMIFFLYGIFLLKNIWLVYLMMIELAGLIIAFIRFLGMQKSWFFKHQRKIREMHRRKQHAFFK
jgi:NhaP-type Na+/H+ or K+/H+ antiporter